jgi:hypothetical protein
LRYEGAIPIAVAAQRHQGPILVIVPSEYVWQLTGLPAIEATEIGDNGSITLVAIRRG